MNYYLRLFSCVSAGFLIYLIPVPQGVAPKGWTLFAIFVSTILGLILKPLPMGPTALIALCVATFTNVLDISTDSLTSFSSPTIWLIILVFFIARGIIKTHLGARIAYSFVRVLGRKTLGLGYGLVLTDLLIAPFIPSNAARAGGIMFPIVRSIAEGLGSYPTDGTENRIGGFLTQICFQSNIITSSMFLTAMAANPLAQSIASKYGVHITWLEWAWASIVPGLCSLLVIPWLLYKLSPPELKTLPEAVSIAQEKLRSIGPVSNQEWSMIGIFFIMLVLWILADILKINPCSTALLGLCLLLITKVLDWKDILHEHEAWHTMIWLSVLVTMSTYLDKYGFMSWFSGCMGEYVGGLDPLWALFFLGIIYFYSHYFFASNTAHVSSMYAPFLGVAVATGAPPALSALLLGFFNSLFSSMTHYGTSPAPILFGAGYVPLSVWWRNGFLISVVNLFIWIVIGGFWWKIIGIW